MIGEVLEHVVHAAATAEVHHGLDRVELGVDARADDEDDEVTVDLGRPASLSDLGHVNAPFLRSAGEEGVAVHLVRPCFVFADGAAEGVDCRSRWSRR